MAVRWGGLEGRDLPLVDGVVGDAGQAHVAVAPGLDAGPFNAFVEVTGFAGGKGIDDAGAATGAAGIHAHAGVAVWDPLFGIGDFPTLVLVAGADGDVGVLADHDLPLASVAVLEGESLGVGTVGENGGDGVIAGRAEDVGTEDEVVAGADRDVPFDAHAIADFGVLGHGGLLMATTTQRALPNGAHASGRPGARPPVTAGTAAGGRMILHDTGRPAGESDAVVDTKPRFAGAAGVAVSAVSPPAREAREGRAD